MDATPKPAIDPFGDTVSPSLYVARDTTERALAVLVDCAHEPARPAVLVGPPGIGKSLLLRLVGERVESVGHRVFLIYPGLDTAGLCMWTLDELRSRCFEDAVFALETYLCHLREIGWSLLLMVDDLHSMPLETVSWLGRCAVNSKGELRVIASSLDDPRTDERITLLGSSCDTVLLESRMQEDDSIEYVRERLRLASAPPTTRSRFEPAVIAELHRHSEGNPRALNAAAAWLLRPLGADTFRS